MGLHRVFISYHHMRDQPYKEAFLELNAKHGLFVDASVDTGGVDDNLDDQAIRRIIRDRYLGEATVIIVLVGAETRHRKHVDWELYSSMYDGAVHKKLGVLVVNLPSAQSSYHTAAHGEEEKESVYPSTTNWTTVEARSEYLRRYPKMPDRIVDNLLKSKAKISVVPWQVIAQTPEKLRFLIEVTNRDRASCEYDLSRPMRRANS